MTREYVGVSESDSLRAAVDLLLSEDTDTAVVLRGTDPVGTLTATDALEHLAEAGSADDTVTTAMSDAPPTIASNRELFESATAKADADGDCLLVTEEDELVGVVTNEDLVGAMASFASRPSKEPTPAATDATGNARALENTGGGRATEEPNGDDYSTQSVCETCGSLTPELRNVNGQLVCVNCREI